jgi:uncharacterized protein (DUF58 family)
MTGSYESTFRGRGIEFDEVREYQPGDDVRLIDWNVTARTGRPHIKRFVEERELSIVFLVDLSRSMAFGSAAQLKRRIAAELCAVLAFSAIKHSDRAGLLLATDHIEQFTPPSKGSRHVLRVIREVLSFEPRGTGTNLAGALDFLNRVLHQRSVVFVVSDFFASGLQKPLAMANRAHDVIAVHLVDPREETLPPIGYIRLEDAETGRAIVVNAGSAQVRQRVAEWSLAHRQRVEQLCSAAGVDRVEVRTDQSYMDPLHEFFRRRALRR